MNLATDPVGTQLVATASTFTIPANAVRVFSLPLDVRASALEATGRYPLSASLRVRTPGAPLWTAVPGNVLERCVANGCISRTSWLTMPRST